LAKKRFIVFITFIGGLYYFLEFVVPGLVPTTGVKGKVEEIRWGRVTYRLYGGETKPHVDEGIIKPGKVRPEPIEIKRRNSLDDMKPTDMSLLQRGDVIAIAGEKGGEITQSYGKHPEITIGPKDGDPAIQITPERLVLIDGKNPEITPNRSLQIDRGVGRIWNVVRWDTTPVKAGDVIRGKWYDDMKVDFTDEITITDKAVMAHTAGTRDKPREVQKIGHDDVLVLGVPVITNRNPRRLGLIGIRGGQAVTSDGQRYDLSRTPIEVTPPVRPGDPSTIRVGSTRMSLPAKENLYKFATWDHTIKIAEHIEITPDTIKITQRGVVKNVRKTRITVRTSHGDKTCVVTANSLIFRRTTIPVIASNGMTVPMPREDTAAANELKVGDRVTIGRTTYLTALLVPIGDFINVMCTFGIGLGMFNLILMHGSSIRKRQGNWLYSLILFVAMFGMMFFTSFRNAAPETTGFKVYDVLFWNMMSPLGSTTFSLLAFYLASAAYRAFKIKTAEAAVMSISAVIIMMGQVPIGIWLTHGLPDWLSFLRLEVICGWIFINAHSPAYRAISLGATVGAIAMALRLWLNLERGTFFDQEL
jgi:hypothetical protein